MRLRVLLACAVLPLLLWLALPLPSSGQGPARLQEKIEKTQEKINRKKGTERVLTSDITAYTRRINRLQARIGSLQQRQARLQADVDRKRAQLVQIQMKLRDERARLTRLRARLIVTRRALSKRLVEMYKAEKPDVLTVVLNSEGFADMLSRGEFIRRIADQDRRIVKIVRDARVDAKRTADRLDRLERRQQQITAEVLLRRNQVAEIKGELIDTRVGYDKTRSGKKAALSKVRVDRHELEGHLVALEKEEAKITARLASNSGGGGGGNAGPIRKGSGALIWPANGPISSGFGARWGRLHAGVDIPLPNGTPLRAADAGRVAIAGWTGGYGNYTCVQHGGAMSTCYAHQTSIGVSVGQNVSQGQVIGQSGNTGNSTGPHLHFEVRINGSPVDPMGYL